MEVVMPRLMFRCPVTLTPVFIGIELANGLDMSRVHLPTVVLTCDACGEQHTCKPDQAFVERT